MLLAGHFRPRGEHTDEANLRERQSARPSCHWPAGLIEQQYRASGIYIQAVHGLALDRWLAKRRVALAEARIERYQDRHRPIRTMSRLAWRSRPLANGANPGRDIVRRGT